MCGRFLLTATPEEVTALFGYLDAEWFPSRYNIAPTQPIAIVRFVHGARRFALARWGLVPAWVEDPRAFSVLFNARSESAAERPAFSAAMRYRRCLVPASGFYEWRRGARGRGEPFWVRPRGGGVIAFAGLWETWSDRDGGEIDTGCVLTTASNAVVAEIHDRMPAVIAPKDFDRWLTAPSLADVQDLLRPAPDDFFDVVAIGDRVNKADNDDPGVLEPPAQPRLPL